MDIDLITPSVLEDKEKINMDNCTMIFLDYQFPMIFNVKSIDSQKLINNAVNLARIIKILEIPFIISIIADKDGKGVCIPQLSKIFSKSKPIGRVNINAWDDKRFINEIKKIGREKLIFAGIGTDQGVSSTAISAYKSGFDVYIVKDACGDETLQSHENGIKLLEDKGIEVYSWLDLLIGFQFDWNSQEKYNSFREVIKKYISIFGQGLECADDFINN